MPKSHITVPFFIPFLGCPNRCVYCNQRRTAGREPLPDAQSVREKTLLFLSTINSSVQHRDIAFFGGTFTALPLGYQIELLSSAAFFIQRGLVRGIRVSTRPDCISEDSIEFLKNYGVTTIELGAQSFSDEVLALSGRGHDAGETRRAFGLVKSGGMDCVLQLMPGLPGDTTDLSLESARIAADMGPDGIRIYPAVVIRDTPLEVLYNEGAYVPLTLEQAVDISAEMHRIFISRGIEVIKTGLHPLRAEERDAVVAGPYHPAFGFMVKSRIKRDILYKMIRDEIDRTGESPSECTVIIPEKEKEEYIGLKKENLHFLKERFGFINLRFHIENTHAIRIVV